MKTYRSSLAKKVYWITAGGFLAFTALFMVLQLFFFEDYSLKMRAAKLERDFASLYDEIIKMKSSNARLKRMAEFDGAHYSWTVIETRADRTSVVLSNWPDGNAPSYINCVTPELSELQEQQSREGTAVVFLKEEGKVGQGKCSAALALLWEAGGVQQYMYTFSSPQPVTDAASLLGTFYLYFFLAAVIPLLGFAFLFTSVISRPLVQLNEMAKRLVRLDFSARTKMKRNDEIGELAATFDYLATKLNGTMGELKAANEQLQHDIDKEKGLELLRKRFVANVSHELKTPVSLIHGYAEMLRDNVGQEAKRNKYASVIMNETERLTRLVKDLLDLSQLESGHFNFQWSKVPLRSSLEYVLQSVEPLALGRILKLDWQAEDEVMVLSDPHRLEQIMTNLLTNAIRHTPEGGRIELRVRSGAESNCVLIEVMNEGAPIEKEHLRHVWDAFYRADASGSRGDDGNGIGLSIVKHLLDRHGSRYLISNMDGGVMLAFTLPIASPNE